MGSAVEGRAVARRWGILPADEVVIEAYLRHGKNRRDTAAELGCSESAIGQRLARIEAATGERIRPPRAPHGSVKAAKAAIMAGAAPEPVVLERVVRDHRLEDRIRVLEGDVATLLRRVDELEQRPGGRVRLVEFRPDHRRIADGGESVRSQRRRAKRAG